ncbi:hypothetical protein EUX98_g8406 [Antrodiella citrinella]|uniref:F-box domain-containing protein n=1 Tax=Antrodiella citrinella TaxID=2447956 RepID=A0A4S4M7M4_9APHY|nr:hypothetical protein EUX98_g8406 [Antrodiella citrinella]
MPRPGINMLKSLAHRLNTSKYERNAASVLSSESAMTMTPPDRRVIEATVVFPPELDDYLMNIMSKDPNSLKTCALVCRAWLAASRVYLFRDVTIENEDMFLRFEDVVVHSPMIQDRVRTLRIDRSGRRFEMTFPWINNNLSLTLPTQLTLLEAFEMHTVQEKHWKPETFHNLSQFTTVTRLSVLHCGFSTDELFGIVSAFPALSELRISHFIELFSGGRKQPVPMIHKPKLESLVLHCSDIPARDFGTENLLDFLTSRGCVVSLKRLDIEMSRRNVVKVGAFVRRLGPPLKELQLRFVGRFGYHDGDLPNLLDNVNLTEHVNLKQLTLEHPAHPATRTLLARIASPTIRVIEFYFQLFDVKTIIDIAPDLERALTAPHLERLAEVRFAIEWATENVKAVEETCRNAFPELHQRKILRVVRRGD